MKKSLIQLAILLSHNFKTFKPIFDPKRLQVFRAYAKYPNEIIDTPIVNCEPDRINIKIRTSTANPSHIYAEDFHHSPGCTVRNSNSISIYHNDCGMTQEKMENPSGAMYRICVSVQIHPLFVTDSDKSYCAQCVYMDNAVVDDLEQNLSISEISPNELEPQFDASYSPQCVYSIRKGSFDGPEVRAAVVGETVFHVWQCSNANVGILVQNCSVEDLQGEKILIIDQKGCGVDQYLFKTPQYSANLQTAFLESNVFKFVDKSMTRFRCQIRLCLKNHGSGCAAVTPPTNCPSIDGNERELVSSPPLVVEDISEPRGPPGAAPPGPSDSAPAGPPGLRPPGIGLSTAQVVPRPAPVVRSGYNYGGYASRQRRAARTLVRAEGGARRRRAVPGAPAELAEVDVVGLIRVLDNTDDLELLADPQHANAAPAAGPEAGPRRKCLPGPLYYALLAAVLLLALVQVAAGLFVCARVRRQPRKPWSAY